MSESEESYGQIIEESLQEFQLSLTLEELQAELNQFKIDYEEENKSEPQT